MFKRTILIALSDGIKGVAPLIALPFITQNISVADVGYYSIALLLINLFASISVLGGNSFLIVQCNKAPLSHWRHIRLSLLFNASIFSFCVFLTLVVIQLQFPLTSSLLLLSKVAFCSVLAGGILMWNSYFIALKRPLAYLVVSMCFYPIIFFTWALLSYKGQSDWTLFLDIYILVSLSIVIIPASKLIFDFSKRNLKKIVFYQKKAFYFGIRTMPHTMSIFFLAGMDRLLIMWLLGEETVAVYAVTMQIGLILVLLTQAINKAWMPLLFTKLKTGLSEHPSIVRTSYFLGGLIICFSIFAYAIGYLYLINFYPEPYHKGLNYLHFVIASYSINGIYLLFVNFLFYFEKTGLLSKITASLAMFNCIISYVFIIYWGAVGAIWATAICYIFATVVIFISVKRIVRLPWRNEFEKLFNRY